MSTFDLQRVQHVSVARPRGAENAAAARRFYGEILGLQEITPPDSLAFMDLIWFKLGDNELHVFPIDDKPVDYAQHFCIQLGDVDALRAHLRAHDVSIIDDVAIRNRPRFFCHDPFGNRIEFTTILGSYSAP